MFSRNYASVMLLVPPVTARVEGILKAAFPNAEKCSYQTLVQNGLSGKFFTEADWTRLDINFMIEHVPHICEQIRLGLNEWHVAEYSIDVDVLPMTARMDIFIAYRSVAPVDN
jgi:hypothetical protein